MIIVDTSEVEALKSALAKAKKEAEEEPASRLKHELRVEEVQQELKGAMGKCESLERKSSEQNSELSKHSKAHRKPGPKPKALSGRSRRQGKLRRGRPLTYRANL